MTAKLAAVMAAVAILAFSASASPMLQPDVLWVPDEHHTGSAYTAVQAAPDGRVYLGTTFYDGFARLLMLVPGSSEFKVLADMASATGERTPGPYAQAKIHTKPAVAADGKVYFGTKSGKPAASERWQAGYPGGHLLVYDPRTGRVSDLGIVKARQSLIAVGVDHQRGVVYVLTDPDGHLVTYDPRTKTFADKGTLADGHRTRYLVVLRNGDVYHPAEGQAFHRYRAAADRIERIPLVSTPQGLYESPYALTSAPDGASFYGVGNRSGRVYQFLPGERTLTVRSYEAIAPEGFRLPGTHYAITTAPDGNIYYTATLAGASSERTLFIMRLSPAGRVELVGRVAPPPLLPPSGRFAAHVRKPAKQILIQGMTAGPDGTLYVMTAYPLRVLVFSRLAAAP